MNSNVVVFFLLTRPQTAILPHVVLLISSRHRAEVPKPIHESQVLQSCWPKDTLPKDTLPRDTSPTDILPIGHFTEMTFCRTDHLPKIAGNFYILWVWHAHTKNCHIRIIQFKNVCSFYTIFLLMSSIYMCTNFIKKSLGWKHSVHRLWAIARKYINVFS